MSRSLPLRIALLVLLASAVPGQFAVPRVLDAFDRPLDEVGLRILDWEGHLANPALSFHVVPPPGLVYPVTLVVQADHPRLYFIGRSGVGPNGPRLTRRLQREAPERFRLSIFPDRAGGDELHALTVTLTDDAGTVVTAELPVHVLDQDRPERGLDLRVRLDFSEDEGDFFHAAERAVARQAADDWSYFLADPGWDRVRAGEQSTFIWNWPLGWTGSGGHTVQNQEDYAGFLMYAYGIRTTQVRSGGAAASCCFQRVGGAVTNLRRGGDVAIEVRGNFNTLGWLANTDEDAWWVSRNLASEPNDLYSIVHHEMGHALAYISTYPGFRTAELAGAFEAPSVVDYQGGPVPVDGGPDHLTAVDRLSRRGAFGSEYQGPAPARRWLPTKLDLLLVEAIGWKLRDTSAFTLFEVVDDELARVEVGAPYDDGFAATSSLPLFDWTLVAGELPPGVALDRFTGRVHGTPRAAGLYPLVVRVRDHDERDLEGGRTFAAELRVGRAWRSAGGALPGAGPGPLLGGTGAPACDERIRIGLTGARPRSVALLIAGAEALELPLLGGLLVPRPDALVLLGTDATGAAELAIPWPCALPELWLQAWQPDPAGPAGWVATGALAAVRATGAMRPFRAERDRLPSGAGRAARSASEAPPPTNLPRRKR